MFEPIRDRVPEVVDVDEDDPGTYSTIVPVAVCRETDRALAVACELAFTSNHGTIPASAWFHEFSFAIAVIDRTGIELPYLVQDRTIARRYLPELVVPLVMPIVLRSLDALVARVRPIVLYRVTKARNPSGNALRKHNLVTDRLQELGYEMLQKGVDSAGRNFWAMRGPH